MIEFNRKLKNHLLILQPTPFCNLDCSYCYLPNRSSKARMSLETVEASIKFLLDSQLINNHLSIIWHAGEPLVVPLSWYREAETRISDLVGNAVHIQYSFQTNGLLINEEWAEHFKNENINVGLSIDGPKSVHDAYRKFRGGAGSHDLVMEKAELLRTAGVDFHVISVVTKEAVADPKAYCDFFEDFNASELCINFEEVENANTVSTLFEVETAKIEKFFDFVLERVTKNSNFRIREVNSVLRALRDPQFGNYTGNMENQAFDIISVDTEGNISTFSPELLGQHDKFSKGYFFGNVYSSTIGDIIENDSFKRVQRAISQGVNMCKQECPYFSFCRGGSPSNKIAENKDFASTETKFCKIHHKTVVEKILRSIEERILN